MKIKELKKILKYFDFNLPIIISRIGDEKRLHVFVEIAEIAKGRYIPIDSTFAKLFKAETQLKNAEPCIILYPSDEKVYQPSHTTGLFLEQLQEFDENLDVIVSDDRDGTADFSYFRNAFVAYYFPNEGSGELLYEEDFDNWYYQNQGFKKEDSIEVVYFLFGP
jgi:hypothetical protein